MKKRQMMRAAAVVVSMAMTAASLTACGGSGAKETPAATTKEAAPESKAEAPAEAADAEGADAVKTDYLANDPLRVGTMPHQMGVSLWYADKNDLFKEAGINVDLAMFSGGAAINEAIGAGELDGAISGLATVYALANNLVTMVGEVDTAGADGIVVRNDSDILAHKGEIEGKPEMYGSADTLKGKSYVCQLGQAQQFYVSKYISQFGLTDDDITFINMEDASGYQAFMSGEGDVIGTKMPYIYTMAVEGDYTICASVEDATGIKIKDCVIFSPAVIGERRDEIKIFLQVIYGVIDKMEADPAFRKEVVKEFYGENGIQFVEEQLDYELEKNELLGSKVQGSAEYMIGDGMQSVADFYGTVGTIDPANVDNVYKNYDNTLISEALGVEVKKFSK